MNRNKSFLKCFVFVFTLMFSTACEREGHLYVNFINHSNIPVWVHVDCYSEDPKNFRPMLTDDYVEANDTLLIGDGTGFDWESSLYTGMMMVICVYSQSLSAKPDNESYEEFKQKYLLHEEWHTKEELNKLKWTINYYPEENNIKSNHAD